MELSLKDKCDILLNSHPRFQEKNLLRIRLDLSQEILDREMSEDKRSWLLHQLSGAHTAEEVAELSAQIIS